MRLLKSCLLDEPLPRLSAIADAWDIAPEAASTREMAEAVAGHMLTRDAVSRAVNALQPEAQAALGALVAANGRMPAAAFERRFGAVRPMGPGKLERERPWLAPANPTETLWYRGFIFRGFDRSLSNPVDVFYLPTDLLPAIADIRDWRAVGAEARAGRTPSAGAASAIPPLGLGDCTLDDITALLSHIQNNSVRLQPNGRWHTRSAQAVEPMLRQAGLDDAQRSRRFAFMERLIARMGWLRATHPALRLAAQPVMDWLQQTPVAQLRALWDAWRDDAEWNDLRQIERLSFEMEHAWSNHPQAERAAVCNLLAEWAQRRAGQPFALAEFISDTRATHPDFARIDGRYDTWHIRDAVTGQFLHGFEHWDDVEGALIASLLEGPLQWLGVIHMDNGMAHLTEFGRHMLLGEPAPQIAAGETGRLRVEPEGEVWVSGAARWQHFQLARIADWAGFENGGYVFRLSPASLARGREQGISAPRVIEFLQRHSDAPAPANLLRAIRQWGEHGVEAQLEGVTLLRAKDAATLDMLLALPAVRNATVERLSPTCAIVRSREADAVAAEIARSGLLVERAGQPSL